LKYEIEEDLQISSCEVIFSGVISLFNNASISKLMCVKLSIGLYIYSVHNNQKYGYMVNIYVSVVYIRFW